jgi:hypothetical protein
LPAIAVIGPVLVTAKSAEVVETVRVVEDVLLLVFGSVVLLPIEVQFRDQMTAADFRNQLLKGIRGVPEAICFARPIQAGFVSSPVNQLMEDGRGKLVET